MILSFMTRFPWGATTDFKTKIITGEKVHTLRTGNGWFPGRRIHHWSGSPRNTRGKDKPLPILLPFNKAERWELLPGWSNAPKGVYDGNEMPGIFGMEKISQSLAVPLCYATETVTIGDEGNGLFVEVGFETKISLPKLEIERFAEKDGFDDLHDFIQWFSQGRQEFIWTGQLVHWTKNHLYHAEEAETINP